MQNEEWRFGAATDEQIALARKIVRENTDGSEVSMIIAAIQMTTELAADLVATRYRYGKRGAEALRSFNHLKGHPQ